MRYSTCTCLACAATLLLNAPAVWADAPADGGVVDLTIDEETAEKTAEREEPADEPATQPAQDAHHQDEDAEHAVETLVVTATPLEHDRDELAVPVDRVDREDLLEKLGATLGESLATRPGIATTGFAGGASRPVIRGQDAFRTEVTEDGLSTQDVSRESPDHAVPVNPLAVERVEVVRGPATLRYSGGASAGVVNAITHRVPDALPEEVVSGELWGGFDSAARRREGAAVFQGRIGQMALHADLMGRFADDYEIPDGGTQNGTFADSFSGSMGGSYFFGENGRLGFAYTRFDAEYGIPEEDEDAAIVMDANRYRFEGDWRGPVPGLREIRLRGLYTDYEHQEKANGEVGQAFRNDQFDGRLEFLHEEFLGFIGAVGFTGLTRDLEGKGEAASFIAPSTTDQFAFYFFEERALLPSLVGEFGFRVEGNIVDGRPFEEVGGTPVEVTRKRDRTFVPVSGSLGLVYTPSEDLTLGFVGGVSQRAPTSVELFARGPHEATGTFEIGDPDLDEETSYTGQLRATWARDRFRVEVAGFVTFYDDYVFGQLTGVTVNEEFEVVDPDDPEALDLLLFRERDALFAGTEVFAQVDLFDALGGTFALDAQMDWVRARFTKGSDNNVPRIPPIRWGGNLTYRSDYLLGRVGFVRTQDQRNVSSFENSTNSFTFMNVSLTFLLAPFFPRMPVELTFQGLNLTDHRARNVVSFNADEVLLPGRNFRGTMRVRF